MSKAVKLRDGMSAKAAVVDVPFDLTNITNSVFRKVAGVILVFDLTNRKSFN